MSLPRVKESRRRDRQKDRLEASSLEFRGLSMKRLSMSLTPHAAVELVAQQVEQGHHRHVEKEEAH